MKTIIDLLVAMTTAMFYDPKRQDTAGELMAKALTEFWEKQR